MDLINVVILSVVEGVTEFLPISSTGHLVLVSKLLNIPQTEFNKSFEIIIQLGAILAVVFIYIKKLFLDRELLKRTLIAFLPTGILGFLFYKIIKVYLLGNIYVTLVSLIVGGLIMIYMEKGFKGKSGREIGDLTYTQSFGVGLIQSVSMIPGVSRAAATILGGMFLGLSRKAAVELSFILAIPTMAAATGYDLLKNYKEFEVSDFTSLGIGFVISFMVALIVVKWLLNYIKKYDFVPFGIYRIILAILFFLIIK